MKALSDIKLSKGWDSFLSFRERRLQGVQTGIRELDRLVLGLSGSTVIQGAPGCMKSTLALQVAHHQASLGNPVLIIDRENGLERFRMRLISQANGVSTADLLTCQKETLKTYIKAVYNLPIYICTENTTPPDLDKALAEMWELHKKPMLLVVDSLQAMPFIANDERMSIQSWMQALDDLKLKWQGNLVALVTSEKSRGAGGDHYDKASLSSGKGSGNIEYKAEIVLDLRRSKSGEEIVCEVLKNRDGVRNVSIGLVPMLSDPSNAQSFCFKLRGVASAENI